MAAAGALLTAGVPLRSGWAPESVALTHLGTLGLLGSAMLGALYQMTPVVAGIAVPRVGLARAVHGAWALGVAAMVAGVLLAWPRAAAVGGVLLAVALLGFLVPVGSALARAPARTPTVAGMRLALVALLAVAVLGLRALVGHAGGTFPVDRAGWLHAHLLLALGGWVGGLLVSVSWQVVPMFYLTPLPSSRGLVPLAALGVAGVVGAVTLGAAGWPVEPAWAAAPLLLVVWGLHPVSILRAIAARKRRLADGSSFFWRLGMGVALLLPGVGLWALLGDDPRAPLLFGWLAVWGWAGAVVHGMLSRIVPFLVWFHHFSPLVGKVPVPPMRQLWPEARLRLGFGLHVGTLLLGVAGLWWGPALRLAGLGLLGTAGVLGYALVVALRRRP
jgi:hypothetical protein